MRTARAGSLAERASAALSRATDVAELADNLFQVVAGAVPFVSGRLTTVDPVTGLTTGVHRFPPSAPDDDLRSPGSGSADEWSFVCRVQRVAWATLAIRRTPGQRTFTAQETDAVAAVREAVATAVRRVLLADPPGGVAPVRVPAVLLLDADDRVTDSSAAADLLIEDLGGDDLGALPATLLAVAVAARSADGPSTSVVRGRSGGWLSLRAWTLAGRGTGDSVVLTVETAPHAAVGQIALAARGLTVRETEIVGLVLHGESTKSISTSLHLSPHTVQDHLKAVFGKVGVSSRRELTAQFLD